MLLVATILRDSGIHGLGVFAREPISKGTPVWRFDPLLDLKIPASASHTPLAQQFLDHYGYIIEEEGEAIVVLCGDHARFMNHDDEANTGSLDVDPYTDIALRDIEAGEEITCDYRLFDLGWDEKLH